MKAQKQKIDPRQLTGEALYAYFTIDNNDKEYASLVRLLPVATGSMGKTCEILERSVKEGLKLRAVYPAYGKESPASWEYIGDIPDGELYLE